MVIEKKTMTNSKELQAVALNAEAMQKAVEVGVQQFQQQMTLGGGSLNQMFEKVILAYLGAAVPVFVASDSNQSGYDTREDSCKGTATPIREMTVDEVAKELEIAYDAEIDSFEGKSYCNPSSAKAMALALAELGAIRIVGGGE